MTKRLHDELRLHIEQDGPITVERYMALALGHPTLGYYTTRDPFGAAGDFTTAPEISQVFGELLGLWAAAAWQNMGSPGLVRLVELGPGRGTLMADALRAARALPAFRAAVEVHLVETSPVLREAQARTLGVSPSFRGGEAEPGIGEPRSTPEHSDSGSSLRSVRNEGGVTWHASIDTLPPGPAIILANEFFDALPIRQFVKTPRGWCERLVGLAAATAAEPPSPLWKKVGGEGRPSVSRSDSPSPLSPLRKGEGDDNPLAFGLAAEPERSLTLAAPDGSVFEICPAGRGIMRQLSRRIGAEGGALLAIDYGHGRSGFADTLQAVRHHRFVDPLGDPGEADLTAHVDFAMLAGAAAGPRTRVSGPAGQGAFLRALGIEHRAKALSARATPAQAADIAAAVARLTGPQPGMGDLFKVLAVTSADSPPPPGFEEVHP